MSDHVIIEPEGIVECNWNPHTKAFDAAQLTDDRALVSLRCECRLDSRLTLLGFFRAVARLPTLTWFIRQYSWCKHIDEFHAQAEEPMRSEDRDIEYLELFWSVSNTRYKGESDFEISAGLHGVGAAGKAEYMEDGRELYSVSYSPMWELADLPLRLNEDVRVYPPLPCPVKDYKPLVESKSCFSLLEVLDAIYDDISFMGGPAENAAFLEEMRDTRARLEAGVEECIPLDDVLEDTEE